MIFGPRGGRGAHGAARSALSAHLVDLDLTLTALGGGRVQTQVKPTRPWMPGPRAVRLVHRVTFADGDTREERTLVVFGPAGWTIAGRSRPYRDTAAAFDELTRSVVERLFAGRMELLSRAFHRDVAA